MILSHRPRENEARRPATAPPEGTRAERDADAQQDRPEEQPNIQNSIQAHRAAKARKAGSKLSDKRDADAKNKKGPRQKERRRRNKNTQAATPRARGGAKRLLYIFLFFSFSLGEKSVPRPEIPYRFPPTQIDKNRRSPKNPLFMGFFGG